VFLAVFYHIGWSVAAQLYFTLGRPTQITTDYFLHMTDGSTVAAIYLYTQPELATLQI